MALDQAPPGFVATLGPLPAGVRVGPLGRGAGADVILLFAREGASLPERLEHAKVLMSPETALWICWAKKSSPLATEVTEALVRERGLAAGIVDIKVCAVDDDWSGLKFVYRLKDRPALATAKGRKKKAASGTSGPPPRPRRSTPSGRRSSTWPTRKGGCFC